MAVWVLFSAAVLAECGCYKVASFCANVMLLPWLTCVRCGEGLLLYNMCFAICNFIPSSFVLKKTIREKKTRLASASSECNV